ncbi:YbgC/FadM family acyl-CoA thioesterase [Qipengyuania sp. 1NDH17]|uniref:YbgC/FadM family acyl-CoA thioesterase n=1 Tax=Qipengyuania polymorpha TaxID=2867234 RepID=A0ABS7J3I3_9SPHN|nr:YbgC/FadM family acyl-CoA thioesterase [Qipengyuania polymorpha]MBX7459135.1 YbgC/FadM family acyl-CoA thioesterase [Qipengyuania polymorpha]
MDERPNPPDGVINGDTHLYAVRAYYEDTDLSGIVYHANYLRWFERARSDLLRRLDIDQRAAIEEGGGAYAVSEINLKYLRPAKLDDDITIHTRCTELKAASCRMHQKAFRGEELLAEAHLRVGFVSPNGRPIRQPEEWRAAFARFVDQTED